MTNNPEKDAPTAPVGEAVGEAGAMPGTTGFTLACFKAADVPVGTRLYTAPQPTAAAPDVLAMNLRLREVLAQLVNRDFTYSGAEADGANPDCLYSAVQAGRRVLAEADALAHAQGEAKPEPINMVLHCPKCGLQHIDMPEDLHDIEGGCDVRGRTPWPNPPHRSHLCHGCGHIWRPADVPTNGVAAVKTKGKNDSPEAKPEPRARLYFGLPFSEAKKRILAMPVDDARELAISLLIRVGALEDRGFSVATPEPQEGRKPISKEQRYALFNTANDENFTCMEDFYAGIDAAERFHGITQDGERDHG